MANKKDLLKEFLEANGISDEDIVATVPTLTPKKGAEERDMETYRKVHAVLQPLGISVQGVFNLHNRFRLRNLTKKKALEAKFEKKTITEEEFRVALKELTEKMVELETEEEVEGEEVVEEVVEAMAKETPKKEVVAKKSGKK